MDPYSVLGVRTSASETEIELAYKGRRSQYHPDRYASEGAETIAWATTMMQQVNEAYTLLSDAQSRAQFDRAGPPPRTKAQKPARPQTTSRPVLKEILFRGVHHQTNLDRAYIAPNIPHKKLHAALASYGYGLNPSEVVLVVDDTAFGSAKDGLLLTEKEIRIKDMFQEPVIYPLSEIETVESGGNRIKIDGRQVIKFVQTDAGEMACLMAALNEFLVAMRAYEANEDEGDCEEEQDDEEPDEDVLNEVENDLRRLYKAARDLNETALLELFLLLLRASGEISKSIKQLGVDLDDEEEFVLSSDVVRFELLAYVFCYALGVMANELGRERAAEIFAEMLVQVVAMAVARKENLGDLRRMPESEKLKQMARSRLFKPFQTRMLGYRGMSSSDRETRALFLRNLQEPLMGVLYVGRSREIVKTMIDDVIDCLLDDDITEALLREIERHVEYAIQQHTRMGFE